MVEHSFGLVAAVYNRRSAAITDILRRVFTVAAFNFYNDKYGFDPEDTAEGAFALAEKVHWWLGLAQIKKSRKQELFDEISMILEHEELSPGQALLVFGVSQLRGQIGLAFLRALSDRQCSRKTSATSLSPALLYSLYKWRTLVMHGPPRPILSSGPKKSDVVIFTGGSAPSSPTDASSLSVVAAQVTVTFRPHWVHVLPGRATEQAVVLDVLAPEVTGQPPAQELALLLDVSLSMAEGGKLDLAKAVAERIIRSMRPEDRIHLISCQSFARLEFQHGSLDQKDQLLQKLRQLSAKSATAARQIDGSLVDQDISNISDGLRFAEHILVGPLATPRVNTTRKAMLFSDGLTGPSPRNAFFDAIAAAKVAGFSTSVVGLGAGRAMNRWLLEEAAQAGHGEFLALSSPSSIDKAVAMAGPNHYPTFAFDVELRLAISHGARLLRSYGHRRRGGLQRESATSVEQDELLPLGVLRSGLLERQVLVFNLPGYHHSVRFLTCELLYEQIDGTKVSQRVPYEQLVLTSLETQATWPGADFLHRLHESKLLRKELALHLPAKGTKGHASRWDRLSVRWHRLQSSLEELATEAQETLRRLPSLSSSDILKRIWAFLEISRTAGRGSESGTRTPAPFAVCEGSPELRGVSEGIEGLAFPNR
eukprot:s3967_g10.t2